MVFNLSDMLRILKTDFVEIIEEMLDHLHNQSFIDRNNTNLDSVEHKMYVETHSEQIEWYTDLVNQLTTDISNTLTCS